ncbi:hypothetical protein BGX38DRAFT_1259471 [Terfezia claveryi]|nr:hypothetical protein BGX38DRAFT_1259471 [Terfezia claveryi]
MAVGIEVDDEVFQVVEKKAAAGGADITDEEAVSKKMSKTPVHWVALLYACLWAGKGEIEEFELGQKVWKRESRYDAKGFVPVFAPRWTGPSIVHTVFDKNVYKLVKDPEVTGKKVGYLRNPISGMRLREFVDGEVLNRHRTSLVVWLAGCCILCVKKDCCG